MTAGARVSVVVPTRAGDAPATRAALAGQTLVPAEVVVASGHASPAAGRNAGAARASGDVLVFLDDDVGLEPPGALAHLVATLHARTDAGAVGAVVRLPADATPFQRRLAAEVPRIVLPPDADEPAPGLPTGACLVVRRDAFWAVGGFDERLDSGEDVAFCGMLARAVGPTWIDPAAAVLHRPPRGWRALWRKFVWYGRGQRQLALYHGFGGHRVWVRAAPLAAGYALARLLVAPLHALLDWRGGALRVGFRPRRAWASAAAGWGFGWEAVAGPSATWQRVARRIARVPAGQWPARLAAAVRRRVARRRGPAAWEPTDAGLARALGATGVDVAVAPWRARAGPAALGLAPAAEAVAALATHVPGAARALADAAGRAHARRFGCFGWGDAAVVRDASGAVDWHVDPASGHRFPADGPSHTVRVPVGSGADIKAPWELSRGQHLVTLAQAACAARLGTPADPAGWARHGERALADLEDWIAQNPAGRGVNWTCPMDVALRAANWCVALAWLADHPALTDARARRLLRSLVAHGRYVRAHLERGARGNSNHYLADLVGLTFLGAALPGPDASEWLRFARDEWAREIPAQFGADGGNIEASTCYHRLSLELAAGAAHASAAAGAPFPAAALDRLRAAFRFAGGVANPLGQLPAIGDDDSGRLHVLDPGAEPRDVTGLCDWGALLLGDPDLRLRGGPPAAESCWRFGSRAAALASPATGAFPAAFPDFGLWVLRRDGWWILCRAAPRLHLAGGHAHNDQLAVEVWHGDQPLVVDPGTGEYTARPWVRNAFRSVAAHATLQLDALEPRPLPADCFALPDAASARLVGFAPDGDPPRWEATAEAVGAVGAVHTRQVTLDGGRVEIRDQVSGAGRHTVTVHFPLAAGVAAEAAGPRAVRLSAGGRRWCVEADRGTVAVAVAATSLGYGRVEPAARVVVTEHAELPVALQLTLRPA